MRIYFKLRNGAYTNAGPIKTIGCLGVPDGRIVNAWPTPPIPDQHYQRSRKVGANYRKRRNAREIPRSLQL